MPNPNVGERSYRVLHCEQALVRSGNQRQKSLTFVRTMCLKHSGPDDEDIPQLRGRSLPAPSEEPRAHGSRKAPTQGPPNRLGHLGSGDLIVHFKASLRVAHYDIRRGQSAQDLSLPAVRSGTSAPGKPPVLVTSLLSGDLGPVETDDLSGLILDSLDQLRRGVHEDVRTDAQKA
jgi:hypothetical protein